MREIDWASCPEATHFDPVDQNFLREVGEALLLFNNKRGWTVPVHTAYGLRIEDCHHPLVKRPEWNGKHLPPVGTECEFTGHSPSEHDKTDPDLHIGDRVKIIAHFQVDGGIKLAAFLFNAQLHNKNRGPAYVEQGGPGCFRPIRTTEQIAAEERAEGIEEIRRLLGSGAQGSLESVIWDAGYRKQVTP